MTLHEIYNTTNTTNVTGYHRRLALPCLGKAYCSHLLNIISLLFLGSLLSLGFENAVYFRIVIIPYVKQNKYLGIMVRKRLENKATECERTTT